MKRLTIPVSKNEAKNYCNIDEEQFKDMEYLGLTITPHRAEEGLRRWEKAGCPSPFTASDTYAKMYTTCESLKNGNNEIAEQLKEVYKELSQEKAEAQKSFVEKTTAENTVRLHGYDIQGKADQITKLHENYEQLEDGLKKMNDDRQLMQSNFHDDIRELEERRTVVEHERSEALETIESLRRTASRSTDERREQGKLLGEVIESNKKITDALYGNWFRRFIAKIFLGLTRTERGDHTGAPD